MTAVLWSFAALAWLLPGVGLALTLTALDQERGVVSEALAAEASGFDEKYVPAESTDLLDFDAPVGALTATPSASAAADSSIDSALGPFSISAEGHADASAATTGLDARGRAPADSFFEVLFEADVTGDVLFAGRVRADFVGSDGDAWASVELVDVGGGTTLVSYEAAPGDDIVFDRTVALAANTSYRLTAQSLAYAQASQVVESSLASASYTIAVPEPSNGLQVVISSIVLFGLRFLQRERRCRKFAKDASLRVDR